mgnify:CR=1 FL=1
MANENGEDKGEHERGVRATKPPSLLFLFRYSYRNASIGLRREARQAG